MLQFQTFSERIADINIDVIHKIKHHDDTPDENSTYFGEALEKWTELNCTKHFSMYFTFLFCIQPIYIQVANTGM